MPFDERYSQAIIEQSRRRGYDGVPADSLSTIGTEQLASIEAKQCPWADCYRNHNGTINGRLRPEFWTKGDTFLRKIFGTNVSYMDSKIYYPEKTILRKKEIGRYSSGAIIPQLKKLKVSTLTENELLKDVDTIAESCDLRNTTATILPKLKSIGGNLTVDTSSKLAEGAFPLLKQIGGKLTVIAKNQGEMMQFLAKIGLNIENLSIAKGIHFVMKNYL